MDANVTLNILKGDNSYRCCLLVWEIIIKNQQDHLVDCG